MTDVDADPRMVLVDASVFITLAEINLIDALLSLDGRIVVPSAVEHEITSDPARQALESAEEAGTLHTMDVAFGLENAADYLGRELSDDDLSGHGHLAIEGDIALLALALRRDEVESGMTSAVVVTDDKPLRKSCKALSIPVSGSIGVLVRAVERGDLGSTEARRKLYAMDEVGARLSATLVRKAERLIDDAVSE